ncbi:NAD(P)H-dependent oxidoreductase [Clostridium sp. cel8]|jgi:nitroreductase|uniref:NAD(P)H-dependent oxidoreductase n=1 Tax=unclassified Clostridium TaxID=2614128 RepID=UPI0015F6E680|nr:NAD(P)H-dependent oxidoreductase [Clostridium sp. cel8]MBA5851536.1 NAD(P)H-dependent oxidoreductase [Clostridium sp. cel8]
MNKKDELIKAYNFRFACKEFDKEKKISDDDFNFILETGRLSPSSFGWEPWKFVVVQNMDLREKLKEFSWGAQKQLPTASHFVLLMVRKSSGTKAGSDYLKYMAKDVEKLPQEVIDGKMKFYKKFQESDFDLTDDRKLFDWAGKQVYIPLANMMTAAAFIGIDSCPMEGFDREKIEEILSKEGIIDTNEFGLAVMVAFGYRSPNAEIFPKTRQPIDKVVEWIK